MSFYLNLYSCYFGLILGEFQTIFCYLSVSSIKQIRNETDPSGSPSHKTDDGMIDGWDSLPGEAGRVDGGEDVIGQVEGLHRLQQGQVHVSAQGGDP